MGGVGLTKLVRTKETGTEAGAPGSQGYMRPRLIARHTQVATTRFAWRLFQVQREGRRARRVAGGGGHSCNMFLARCGLAFWR